MKTIVLCTGGFDPIHSGHLEYFKSAKALGDYLIVGINSDSWLTRKKGRPFMLAEDRMLLVSALKMVDEVIAYDDSDNSSCDAITQVLEKYPDALLVFANGGDRTKENIPEMCIANPRLTFKFGVGGNNKINSSSWILEDWKKPRTTRTWGYYRILHEVGSNTKLKELTVNPGASLSMQKHSQRAEFWFVAEGTATVNTLDGNEEPSLLCQLDVHQSEFIKLNQWHQLCNKTNKPLKLIEIQYGENCVEEDIIRK